MSEQCEDGGPVINTAVHLWPKTQSPDAEYLAVWGVGDDAIGIEVGGHVVSKTIRAWFELQADLLKKEEEIARLVLAADDAHLSRIAAEEERELLRKERDQLKSWQESVERHAADNPFDPIAHALEHFCQPAPKGGEPVHSYECATLFFKDVGCSCGAVVETPKSGER